MIKKSYNKLDLDVYEETLDNGLRIYVCKIPRVEAHAKLTAFYGNDILEFKPIGENKYFKVPIGTAHFLEHKMFEQEDGVDIMDIFQKNGASNNAYTNAHSTTYFFTAPNKFFENLENLLNCVTMPYYTDKNVKSEQGIIDQEIKAILDRPIYVSYYTALFNLFHHHPYRYPVAGTSESIKKITPEILYTCYNTFYHPANMVLAITGNVNPKETITYIKNYFKDKKYPKLDKIETKKYDEPKTVYKKEETVIKDLTNKVVENVYKVYIGDADMSVFKIFTYMGIYLDIKFGAISKFNKDKMNDKNVLKRVDHFMDEVDNYLVIHFDTEVMETKNTLKEIYDNINDKEISEDDFNLMHKNLIKSVILLTENVVGVANSITYQVREYGNPIYDMHDIYQNLNFKEFKELIDKLDFTNNTKVVVTNK